MPQHEDIHLDDQDPRTREAITALKALRTRLLDITSRNRLINFAHGRNKRHLRVIDELPSQLAETLLSEKEMRFIPIPEPTRDQLMDAGYIEIDPESKRVIKLKDDPSAEEWAKHLGLSTAYEVPKPSDSDGEDKHADLDIQTLLYPYELDTRLKTINGLANSAIEEMGANILYMTFGFLEWYDTNNDKPRYAPLFLIPATLQKGRLNKDFGTYEYALKYSGEDIIPNLSLREKLKIDFALNLPGLDQSTDPESYFKKISALLATNQPTWRVRRYITLALLNFSKLLMYLDLDPDRWPENESITSHKIVAEFLAGYEEDHDLTVNEDLGFGEEHSIDDVEDIHENYPLIDNADSSQHSAIIDALDGKNLVIEGPPGTGKSQTITNLIAGAISSGKKVLFVAEKLAALEVVKRRLDLAGLGEFCLELHSHKSQKRRIIEDIKNRMDKHGRYRNPAELQQDIEHLEHLKNELREYVLRINNSWKKTGFTIHEILMAATRYREEIKINPAEFHPDAFQPRDFNKSKLLTLEEVFDSYLGVYTAVREQAGQNKTLNEHPWYGVNNTRLQIFDLDKLQASLESWQGSIEELDDAGNKIKDTLCVNGEDFSIKVTTLNGILQDLELVCDIHGDELFSSLPNLRNSDLRKADNYLSTIENIESLYRKLKGKVKDETLTNLSGISEILNAVDTLSKQVFGSVNLETLSESVDRLDATLIQLKELAPEFDNIRKVLGSQTDKHLSYTESGLFEYTKIIEHVSKLRAGLWRSRDTLFDNDELDELLPNLRDELEALRRLHKVLGGSLDIDRLPSEKEIFILRDTLDSGGLFCWFKGAWRDARRKVLALSTNPTAKLKNLTPLLNDAADYSARYEAFKGNARYRETLGQYLVGINTNINDIQELRSWYKEIREDYGVGFGPRVSVGNAILNIQEEYARAIKSLHDQNIIRQITDILEDLKSLRGIFTTVKGIQDSHAVLYGEGGVIEILLNTLKESITNCAPLTISNDIEIHDLVERIKMLSALKQTIDKLNIDDIDSKLFDGQIGLDIGPNTNNEKKKTILKHTLNLSHTLEEKVRNEFILNYIYSNPTLDSFKSIESLLSLLRPKMLTFDRDFTDFRDLSSLDASQWIGAEGNDLATIKSRNDYALQNSDMLHRWLDYVKLRERVVSLGFSAILKSVEAGVLSYKNIHSAYKAAIFDLISREIFQVVPELNRFTGHSQEAIRAKFQQYDESIQQLQSSKISWNADNRNIPLGNRGARVSSYTERHLLDHVCERPGARITIRKLVKRASNALSTIKPCFMMGPMSVAQYLEPGELKFDLVVMDEASQIRPEDALGAIARGAQIVIVGDPKQLPPTSFFQRTMDDGDEEDPAAIQQSQSILDATLPIFSKRRLRWHYRSQHESLIAFSNHHFYNSDLVLFPSPLSKSENYGIRLLKIRNGYFVNRRNTEEASIIAQAIKSHYQRNPDDSLGVVAMSAQQKEQIESSVEGLANSDDEFRAMLEQNSEHEEPLFIKNLENVQGDERDVIYISMTYGPDEPKGRVYQRFGPINSDVGWRRLNVLFTRAKKRMWVFSSMGSEDIQTGPQSNQGVHALHNFLRYCETGILHQTINFTGRDPDSDFEIAVMEELQQAGFECRAQVGVAGFFLDIAVIDPGNPGRYLMAIECDGATYHSAKSTRDRDKLRQAILERLGWKVRRIWSTDWFKNPRAEIQPIIDELNELKSIISTHSDTEIEADEIDDIIEESDEAEDVYDEIIVEDRSLEEKLIHFNDTVIKQKYPDTPEENRLLRQDMIEVLLESMPIDKSEFLESVPAHLRTSTSTEEANAYLDAVLEIINFSFGNAE